ncbi:MAG: OmpA family protein [Bacteroidota bacterium]
MKRIAALLLFIVFSTAAFAQTKKEWLKYADAAFKNGDYKNAVVYYTKVIDKGTPSDITHPYEAKPYSRPKKDSVSAGFKIFNVTVAYTPSAKDSAAGIKDSTKVVEITNNSDQYVIHQIAESYRLNHDYQNAELWYQQSVKNNSANYPYESYWYGDALMKNKKYPAANLQFEGTLTTATAKKDENMIKLVKAKIAGCYMGVDPNSVEKGITVTELDTVFNKGTSSFAVNYYGDESNVQFSTARQGNTALDSKKQNPQYTSDIYMLTKTDTGSELKKVEGPVNTGQNEGAGFLAADKARFFFTRWSPENKNECAIYFSRLFNGEWLIAQKMNDKVNLDGYKSTDASITPDGTVLYYSSNRPGGYGKMDIWYEFIDEEGRTYGEPVNMGPLFNTPEDEVSPFFHVGTSSMYFSSDGHSGFGGLDVFRASRSNDSVWSSPVNLGQPINSSNDDSYFVLDESQQKGFVTSDRKECTTCSGGACNKIYAVSKAKNVYDVKGTVYDAETNAVVPNATITFKDIRSDWEPFVITADASGAYFYELKENVELYMKAQKTNYLGDAGTVITLGLTESKHFERDFFLAPMSSGNISFPNVEYGMEMVILPPNSSKILDNLVEFLTLNNNFKVSIESYTDAAERGLDKNNIKLSEERSKVCFDYLVSKGIAAKRLVVKGYGDTRPLVQKPKTEEDHQKNRRTTFSLIK